MQYLVVLHVDLVRLRYEWLIVLAPFNISTLRPEADELCTSV